MNLKIKRKNYKNKEKLFSMLRDKKYFFSEKNILKRRKSSFSNREARKLIYLLK